MSSTTALNIILGVLVAGLLATLLYLETTEMVVPATTTTVIETTTTTTTVPETTSTTTVPETTTTTTTTTVVPTTEVPVARFFVGVLVVNATTAGERLPPVIGRLTDAGYLDVRGVVGAVPAQKTTLYYSEAFIGEAQIVAIDLGYELTDVTILPISEAPPVSGVGVAKVIVYLGPGAFPELPAVTEQSSDDGAEG
ncbi:MAG: hypothetical protein ACJAR2_003804 [Ilumatobacter sp.]|jgi:hypothetical protein